MDNETKGKFLDIICTRCGNKQIVFGKSSTRIKCEKCNKLLTKTTGGKVKFKTLVKEVFQ